MALVQKKKDDKKYSHLKRVYKEKREALVEKNVDLNDIDVKVFVKERKITRKEFFLDIALITLLIVISLSGYIVARIIR